MQRPRVRDFGPAMIYLLSLTLVGGTAYQYVSNGSRVSRTRASTSATPSPPPTGARIVLDSPVVTAGRPSTVEVRVFDGAGRPLTPDDLRGGSVRFAIVPQDLAQIQPLDALPDGPGCWEVVVSLPAVGGYRLITQVQTDAAAPPLVLGADLLVVTPT